MVDPTILNSIMLIYYFVLLLLDPHQVNVWNGVGLYPRWANNYKLAIFPLLVQIPIVYLAQFSFMGKYDNTFTAILNSFGMTKWTPAITSYPEVGTEKWQDFVNAIWYGELEFYFSTVCGLILSVLLYFGRKSEEIANEAEGEEMEDSSFHIQVNSIHQHFIEMTFPSLIRSDEGAPKDNQPHSPVKRKTKHMEAVYRSRHSERISKLSTKNDRFFLSIKQIKAGDLHKPLSPSEMEMSSRSHLLAYEQSYDMNTEEGFMINEDMLDLIPETPTTKLLPAFSVLDNQTAEFRSTTVTTSQQEELLFTPMDDADDSSKRYMNEIGETINNTWLVFYSALIHVLDFLVSVSLSYEKHALSLLRVFSLIALVICCGQETVDGSISVLLLPLLIFNTSFDMYKRSLLIVYVKMITTTAEYWVEASIAGRHMFLTLMTRLICVSGE